MSNLETCCGFVAILGAPNAGKSTLVNQLVGTKVSIVSPKVQTTRNRVMGVLLKDEAQMILVDTPGIFVKPKRRLERSMVHDAWRSLEDADALVVLIDASKPSYDDVDHIFEQLKDSKRPLFLALNKVDIAENEQLLKLAARYTTPHVKQTFMISALKGSGVKDLEKTLAELMPLGPWLFPEDQLSNISERLLATEITREKIFHKLHDELPYAIFVDTEQWEEFRDGSVKINQLIYVDRESQKSIVLGKDGRKIKAIGAEARKELIEILERPVHLFLHVRVKENWMEDPRFYRNFGLEFKV
ncbi:GTPase Era [Candidatus Bealeia paramacronuclearis]|uniref:GTPase Era n=1 Tax=Candidatus Bealeia paramacronuclearis TaxID=1921001 RepID=A0ABZ2C7A8_9PROT|nr:GTPase Era [Candidatus Bealeia paramacronuclearis]